MTNDVLKVAKYFNVPVEAEIGELLRLDNGVPMENKNIANPDEVTRRGKKRAKESRKVYLAGKKIRSIRQYMRNC